MKGESTADLDWCFKLQEIRLLKEDFPGSVAERPDLRLGELDLAQRPRVPELQQPVDYVIKYRRLNSLPIRGGHPYKYRFSNYSSVSNLQPT